MKILLIDIDSKIPNLALKKIEKYHLDRGDEVVLNYELFAPQADKIYVSFIFDWNKEKAKQWEQYPQAIIGGSGYSLDIELPKDIDEIKPRINMGFTTRGCIRNCKFCIVPRKEGKIKTVGDIYDIWDGSSKNITLLDNNILASPEHFFKITEQIKKEKLRVDFNQGLDCRLLTDKITKRLSEISHIEYRFAFDDIKIKDIVLKKIEILNKYNIKRANWYVLVGFNSTIKEDLERLNILRDNGQNAYVQRFTRKKEYIPIARWANQHHIFQGMTWQQFIDRDENKSYKKYFV